MSAPLATAITALIHALISPALGSANAPQGTSYKISTPAEMWTSVLAVAISVIDSLEHLVKTQWVLICAPVQMATVLIVLV